jgi:lysophospholipase L1-like esterase
MARKHQSALRHAGTVVVLSLLLAGPPALGQDKAPAPVAAPAPETMPAPFSRDCQIGGTAIVEESPLPNVAAALQSRKRVKILAIGASSLVGRRAGPGRHTEQIERILEQAIKGLDVVMINRGISGELAAQAAARIKNLVALDEPDLVLWQVGTNDALAYVPLDELERTVVDTIDWLKAHKVDVVLAGLQYVDRMARDEHYRAVRELLRRVAAKENVMIVRRYEAQRLIAQAEVSGGGLVPDEFQRNEAGYACLSQYIARSITLGIFGKRLQVRPLNNPPAPPQQ